ncbi:RNA polymerase sigma-I factor [Desulfotomaculum nigrificans]|uniref:RNA polymerase sigma-I factor n=1 Tax=Desulfotomaculum nigrificans TaxID=1565 RepID=UPI0001FAE775|nr:RNA polymerase sigma-I factor [Desulfotomaculum nigrificans]MDA8235910.1 RNA polymerase sigma-I factor [Clostridia bacterium]
MSDTVLQLVTLAQQGDDQVREELIYQCKPFIQKVCFHICKRNLTWENDDELSIALLAFNEAINSYSSEKTASFQTFARQIIHQRLVDFFRREGRHQHLPFSSFSEEEETELSLAECSQSLENYKLKTEQEELAEMMIEFEQRLQEFGTSLEELADVCPKHRDTREKLLQVARILTDNETMLASFHKTKRIPAKDLEESAKVSRRVLENGRKYIVALVIILSEARFSAFKSFAGLDR